MTLKEIIQPLIKNLKNINTNFFRTVKENIERGKREELYRPEINIEVIAKVRLETMMMPFNEQIFPKNKFSLVTLHQQLIEYFLFGIASLKGYKLILKYQQKRSDNNRSGNNRKNKTVVQ